MRVRGQVRRLHGEGVFELVQVQDRERTRHRSCLEGGEDAPYRVRGGMRALSGGAREDAGDVE